MVSFFTENLHFQFCFSPVPILVTPSGVTPDTFKTALFWTSIAHNFFSFIMLIAFFVTERPGLVNVRKWIKSAKYALSCIIVKALFRQRR